MQAGGFDKLLLDSLYEDEHARRQLQLQNAGYGPRGMGMEMGIQNPFDHNQYNQQRDPFAMSNTIAPPPNVQMALMAQQQQQQQMIYQQHQQQQNNMTTLSYHYQQAQYPQQMQLMTSANPFGDPLSVHNYPHNSMPQNGNYNLM
ncbi:hypothetical protein L6164_014014 [Bauhinia variegata]|uniref:Uncharacterized protein n=1 Tax=Bauhinia variegata TaxID=167791 RepID=A0ACB9NHQ0_BAUVA|nr:hypothetical protein L6164_014014 [Bauhinia variegata]